MTKRWRNCSWTPLFSRRNTTQIYRTLSPKGNLELCDVSAVLNALACVWRCNLRTLRLQRDGCMPVMTYPLQGMSGSGLIFPDDHPCQIGVSGVLASPRVGILNGPTQPHPSSPLASRHCFTIA